MRRGAAFSTALHLAVLALVYFGLPSLFSSDEPTERPIPVTVYTVADETVLPPPESKPEPEPEKEAAPIPPEPEVAEVAVPPPPEPPQTPPEPLQAPPEPLQAPPEPPAKPEAMPQPAVAPEPLPPPPPKPAVVAKVETAPEPAPGKKPEPPAPPPDPFASLLKSVEKLAHETPAVQQKQAEAKAVEPQPVAAALSTPSDEPLSLSVLDAIRRQVEDNWSLPVGARDAAGLEVEIHIVLLPDGTVRNVRIVDIDRLNQPGEEFFRSMAESAVRAVQRSSPLRDLPPEKYEQWRDITFTFKPPV